jgi:hypothetical protein
MSATGERETGAALGSLRAQSNDERAWEVGQFHSVRWAAHGSGGLKSL